MTCADVPDTTGMLRKKTNKPAPKPAASPKELLSLEMKEIEQIGEKLFRKIDARISELRDLEARIDEKAAGLSKLLKQVEMLKADAASPAEQRHREVRALAAKGMKVGEIAGVLGMPKGEVELILSLAGPTRTVK